MTAAKRYDLVIVGAGMAGGLLAAEATRRGRSVALIEAGGRFDFNRRLAQLKRNQTFADRWPNEWQYEIPGRDRFTDSSRQSVGCDYLLKYHRVKGVGGTTLHWGGRINRLLPSDFRTAALYGMGVDWPVTYEELEPYYSRADWELGVSGTDHPALPPRSRDYPNPGFPFSVDDAVWMPVAQRLGITLHPISFAINSRPYAGRSQCLAFATCQVCPSGARYSADVHVARAEQTGLCDLFTNTVARRIEVNGSGAVQAIHVSSLDKQQREIQGASYVIAAHTIESARLLLLSNCGNHSDQVGRHFMEHIYVHGGGTLPGQRFFPARVGYEVMESLSYYQGDDRRERGGVKLEFTFNNDPLGAMEDRGLWGKAIAQYDRDNFGRWVGINAETEHQPNPDSRISLDATTRDLFGDPVPHIHLAFGDIDRRTQRRAGEIIRQLLWEAGVRDATVDPLSSFSFASHHLGTCRMSDDPDTGVVDRNCRVHGIDNLFVVGGSVFPTAGALQPTLTIAALSLRLADHLLGAA
jgi:choline dehydrogenase-like flavoprotein